MDGLMSIQIDDGITLNIDPGYYLQEPLSGLDIPPKRTTSFNYSGRDGGVVARQLYAMRPITVNGRIYGDTSTSYAEKRLALLSALSGKTPVTLTIVTYDGRSYQVEASVIDVQADIINIKQMCVFKIEFLCPDPLIYDQTNGASFEATLYKAIGGGYEFPYILPVEWDAGGVPTNVINSGEATVYPTITFTGGTGENPIVTNTDTGEFIQVNVNISPGDVLIIDMKNKTVMLNGGNIRSLVEDGSTFWGLEPGGNLLTLETDNGGDDLTGVVEWRPGYLGI